MATMHTIEHRWNQAELARVCAAGLLRERVPIELLDGELLYKLDHVPAAAAFYEGAGMPLRWTWTREEEQLLRHLGIVLPHESIDLAEGDERPAMTQNAPHSTAVQLCREVLSRYFNQGCHVREEKPLCLPDGSEPEPDVVVVPGSPRDYKNQHPSTAWLVVEVAGSSLDFDRKEKAALYARAGLADYWIINLLDRTVEVHRQPGMHPTGAQSHGYQTIQVVPSGGSISPLVRPDIHLAVAEMIP